jgi:hypothetical protein
MDAWLTARLSEIRERLTPADEGSLWLLAFDDPTGKPVLAVAIADAIRHLDDSFVRNLVRVTDGIGARAVMFVVPRRTGQPHDGDHRLWQDLQQADTLVLDLLVVAPSNHWSAAHNSAGRAIPATVSMPAPTARE